MQQLRDDPENAELLSLHEELRNLIDLLKEEIAGLRPTASPQPVAKDPTPPPPPQPEKWSRANHPAFKKALPPPVEEKEEVPITYHVNDIVLAKWMSGDKGFYEAKITSVTGSSTNRIYTVKFKQYDTTETLRSGDLKPNITKRKAEEPAPAAPGPGVVSSAGATMYPGVQKAAEDADEVAKVPKPKKIKAKKELEAGKAKWQAFSSKSKIAKSNKKESMFRTPEGIRGRGTRNALLPTTSSFVATCADHAV